jgi:hypothetical protein
MSILLSVSCRASLFVRISTAKNPIAALLHARFDGDPRAAD